MNIVLYTDDMEAITVIRVPIVFAKGVEFPSFLLPIIRPPHWEIKPGPIEAPRLSFGSIRIRVEWFERKGRRHPFFFTDNEELALLLRSDVLPGQRKEFHAEFERGFIKGLMTVMNR